MTKPLCVLIAFNAVLAGCASLPNATIKYYLPRTNVSFKVVRTVACDAENYLVISNAATPVVAHVADPKKGKTIALSALKGTFSDSDIKVDFYDGGRLKDINASTTGEGEGILKTVISIAVAAFALEGGSKQYPTQCAAIKKAGAEKPLTLTYAGDVKVDTNPPSAEIQIPVDITSKVYETNFRSVIGSVCAVVESMATPYTPTIYDPGVNKNVLHLQEPAQVKIRVTAGGENGACNAGLIWEGVVPVAQLGTAYSLPLPTPVLFGKEVLAASFAESGAMTSVQFTSNTGAGQALNVGNSALQAVQGETTAQKAADIKAEADLIAQQQRLVQCIADPKNCK
jgi:hypothetical protein